MFGNNQIFKGIWDLSYRTILKEWVYIGFLEKKIIIVLIELTEDEDAKLDYKSMAQT